MASKGSLGRILQIVEILLGLFRDRKKGPQEVEDEAKAEVDDGDLDDHIDIISDGMHNDD